MTNLHLVHPIRRDRLIRLEAVIEITGCKKSTIYRLMKEGKFPRNVNVAGRLSAWPESAVYGWVQEKIQEQQEANHAQF
ncbi:helix-turn-helix transcriptional regulator [Comamonas aquatica]|uniref:AlpA family phage regulatory protein n=1 Tax=Comamonas aquatica TaxID=225991 RepID=A0AA42HQL1_9BURK|nr:AlpA family phage regulatory protein [Comamonas aquatica]MDH0362817.1 AlpA family phage regulatory protein [Comamonas aquatica]